MIVDTKAFGPMEIDIRQKLTFPWGIYGFEQTHEYVLMDAQQHPFYWLQSTDSRDIAFVLISPTVLRPYYDPKLDPSDYKSLGLYGPEDTRQLLLSIVTIPEDRSAMTVNLQGPLVVNKETRIGRQCISLDDSFMVRHNILEEMGTLAKESC